MNGCQIVKRIGRSLLIEEGDIVVDLFFDGTLARYMEVHEQLCLDPAVDSLHRSVVRGSACMGFDLGQREMITFCFLMAQGGCEPQLIAHAKGNMNIGNDKEFLLRVVSQCLPYIGYPRSLNEISCVNKAAES